MKTFINLPPKIEAAIDGILAQPENSSWISRAQLLHEKYQKGKKHPQESYIRDFVDVAAYLGMRVPATYAQIAGALYQVRETMPDWQPESVLDLGSGPGTAVWAAKEVWPSLKKATAIDNDGSLLSVSRELFNKSDIELDLEWKGDSLRSDFGSKNNKYDVVILANVLNELTEEERIKVIDRAFTQSSKILVIIEPGTPAGAQIITSSYTNFTNKNFLLSPFINNTFVDTKDFWLHFPQRFKRPQFQRRIRQQMRASSLMASDWEETKYSYITLSKYSAQVTAWGRVVSPIKKQKAWFDITVLTAKGIEKLQVFKRDKEKYNLVRKLKWGDIVESELVNQRIS